MKKFALLALVVVFAAGTPALAKGPAASEKAAEKKPGLDQADPIECRKFQEIGSRLKIKRICMSRSEWAAQAREDRMNIERSQVARGLGPT